MSFKETKIIGNEEFSDDIASGPFEPTWESLTTYQCPEWFRDAEFGIWSHWGPQTVPEMGDWYARTLYLQDGGSWLLLDYDGAIEFAQNADGLRVTLPDQPLSDIACSLKIV